MRKFPAYTFVDKIKKKTQAKFQRKIINFALVVVRKSFLEKPAYWYTKSLSNFRCKIVTGDLFIVLKLDLDRLSHCQLKQTVCTCILKLI